MAVVSRAGLCSPKKSGIARSAEASQLRGSGPETGQVTLSVPDNLVTMRGETSVLQLERQSVVGQGCLRRGGMK